MAIARRLPPTLRDAATRSVGGRPANAQVETETFKGTPLARLPTHTSTDPTSDNPSTRKASGLLQRPRALSLASMPARLDAVAAPYLLDLRPRRSRGYSLTRSIAPHRLGH